MGDIVRRDNQKPVPVTARRVPATAGDPPPATVRVPPGRPDATARDAAAAAPQTVVYVTVPAGQPQPSQPQPSQPQPSQLPPPEVHYHTTVTNHHYAPVRRRPSRTTSFAATLAFVLGLVACAAAFVPQLWAVAHYGSVAAAALAAVALLGAVVVRRTGTGMPLVAVLVAGLGYGLWLKNAGQLPAAWDRLRASSPVPLPSLPAVVTTPAVVPLPTSPPPTSPPPTVAPAQTPPSAVTPPPAAPAKPKRHNLFDMDDSGPPSTDGGTAPSAPVAAVPPAVDRAALSTALEQARTAAAARLNVDYAAASTAAKSAAAAYEAAQSTYAPGSPELSAASQQRIDAYGRLNAVLTQLRADPAVDAAERAARPAGR